MLRFYWLLFCHGCGLLRSGSTKITQRVRITVQSDDGDQRSICKETKKLFKPTVLPPPPHKNIIVTLSPANLCLWVISGFPQLLLGLLVAVKVPGVLCYRYKFLVFAFLISASEEE